MVSHKVVIALIGLPASGKSELGSFLKGLGYHVLPEATSVLILKGLTAGEKADPELDRKVMSLEFSRDYRFLHSKREAQVVETWHTGNIAYAMARSSPVTHRYKRRFLHILEKLDARCLVLDIDPLTSSRWSRRLQKPTLNSIGFLEKVRRYMAILIEEFGLVSATIDARRGFKHVSAKALEIIQSWVLPK